MDEREALTAAIQHSLRPTHEVRGIHTSHADRVERVLAQGTLEHCNRVFARYCRLEGWWSLSLTTISPA